MIPLTPLPYNYTALNPVISTQTLHYHYDKHYSGYVTKTNELIQSSPMDHMNLTELVLFSAEDKKLIKIFNQSAQVWNHEFYWNSLTTEEKNKYLSDDLMTAVIKNFGSVNQLKNDLIRQGLAHFGSGWLWLIAQPGKLKIQTTSNAQTPLTQKNTVPLLCIDLWEHTYYLDWQNLRKDYLQGVLDNLINWQFANQNLQKLTDF